MIFHPTTVPGSYVIEPRPIADPRGFFARAWCAQEFQEHGLKTDLIQANISYNVHKGTLRGMHFQRPPHAEAKVVRCTGGAIFDVLIDLRPDSRTYRQWFGAELSRENHRMLYVPPCCAHGYLTLTDAAEVFYLVSEAYTPSHEGGLPFDDPEFQIQWPAEVAAISAKDRSWPAYSDWSEVDRQAMCGEELHD